MKNKNYIERIIINEKEQGNLLNVEIFIDNFLFKKSQKKCSKKICCFLYNYEIDSLSNFF